MSLRNALSNSMLRIVIIGVGIFILILIVGVVLYDVTADDRMYKKADQSFQSSDYNGALNLLSEYIDKYPENLSLAIETYMRWGRDLSDKENYADSNLVLLTGEKYSKSSEESKVFLDLIQQNYLNMARNSFTAGSYEESIENLKSADSLGLDGYKDQIDNLLYDNYIELAKESYSRNELDDGLVYLEKAKSLGVSDKEQELGVLYDEYYIGLAKNMYSIGKYEDSIFYLEKVSRDLPSEKDQVVKVLFTSVYFDWVDSVAETQGYDKSLQLLDEADEYFVSTNPAMWTEKKVSMYLAWAYVMGNTGNFRNSLKIIEDVKAIAADDKQQDEVASAELVLLDDFSNSLSADTKELIKESASKICGSGQPLSFPYPIFAIDPDHKSFVVYSTRDYSISHLVPPSNIYYVACTVEEPLRTIESCAYSNNHFLFRFQQVVKVKIYNLLNGKLVGSRYVNGSSPQECAAMEMFPVDKNYASHTGDHPSDYDISESVQKWMTNP